MAKPKNAPALFEVIRSAQEKQRKEQERLKQLEMRRELAVATNGEAGETEHLATSLLRAPLFWFKGKQALEEHAAQNPESAEASIPVMREVPPAPAPMAAPTSNGSARSGRIDVAEEARRLREEIAATSSVPVPAKPEPVVYTQDSVPPTPVEVAPAAAPVPPSHDAHYDDVPHSFFDARPVDAAHSVHHESHGDDFDLDQVLSEKTSSGEDSTKGRLVLPMSYTTGIVAGCGVLLLCGAVYLAASLGATKPEMTLAAQKPNPAVLDLTPPVALSQPLAKPAEKPKPAPAPADNVPLARPGNRAPESTSVENMKPIAVPTNVKRIYNLQYVVVLSSPVAKEAQDAVKFLADNGIPATAEQALPGYSRSWYSVITTKGFEKTRGNPEYDAYVAQLTKVMQKYAKSSKWKTFTPDVYKWRAK